MNQTHVPDKAVRFDGDLYIPVDPYILFHVVC